MKTNPLFALLGAVYLLAGCASTEPATTEPEAPVAVPDQSDVPPAQRLRTGPQAPPPKPEVVAVSFGRGIATKAAMNVTFMYNVTRYADGTAEGVFNQSALTEAGSLDLEVDVTCAETDSDAGRAWIGGTVKRNDSSNPLYAGPAGADAWFAVLDRGAEEQTAWITLPKFRQRRVGSAAEFCARQPWSDDDLVELSQGALAIFP